MKTASSFVLVFGLAFFSGHAAATDHRLSDAVEQLATPVEPSEAFRSFVQNLRISGVFSGTPRRIYVDKQVIKIGDLLDAALGIRLVAVDLDARLVVLEDRSGARLSKSYAR